MAARDMLLITALLLTSTLTLPAAEAADPSFAWGADLSQWWSLDNVQRAAALDAATASGMTMIGTDAKDGGYVGWASPTYPGFTAMAPGDGAVERAVRDAHARGLKVLVRFDVFQDLEAAKIYPGAVIGGNPAWVDPACSQVRAYSLAQIRDLLARVPADEINLDHIRYPGTDEVASSARLPCTGSTLGDTAYADRSAIIASWIAEAARVAREVRPGIQVSVSTFGYTMVGPMPNIGQDAARIAPSVDILRPMIYPSYYSTAAEGQPYATVKDATAKGVAKFGAAKIQPWIQAFGAYATRPDLVCEQMKGLRDGGASGGMVWWFASAGTSTAYWKTVGACAPASTSTTTTPTAPGTNTTSNTTSPPTTTSPTKVPPGKSKSSTTTAPSTFSATFTKGGANNWWVEVKVAANQPIATVTASVNGGSPVALPATTWGTYAKSFYVANGSTIVFTAVATDGARAQSAAFAWP